MAAGSPASELGNGRLIRSLFWKVRGAETYLLGSLHFGPAGGYQFSETVLAAFDVAETPYFEISREEMSLVANLIRRESSTLILDIGPVAYDQLRRSVNYDLALEDLKPHFVYFNLAIRPYLEMGLSPEGGVESMLHARAFSNHKSTQGLETAAEQIGILSSFPLDQVAGGIQGILSNPSMLTAICEAVHRGYINGDAATLSDVRNMMNQMPDMARILFTDRESRWIPRIKDIIERRNPAILVVGALHLVGEQGLIERLTAQGVLLQRLE